VEQGAGQRRQERFASVVTVTDTGGFSRADEGTIAWSGHFQLSDHLLTDGNNSQTKTITYPQ
jgi:hypothetical protein